MAAKAKMPAQNIAVNQVFMYLSALMAVVFLAIGGLAWWAHDYTSNMVHNELAAQKIYFPEKGTDALDPKKFPDLQKYAGQLVDTPEKAHAYANGFIGRHLKDVAGGKVYAEVSTLAKKDPKNATLAQQKTTLFQGETLRGILLTSGYGFGMVGKIAGIAAIVAFGAAGLLVLSTIYFRLKL